MLKSEETRGGSRICHRDVLIPCLVEYRVCGDRLTLYGMHAGMSTARRNIHANADRALQTGSSSWCPTHNTI